MSFENKLLYSIFTSSFAYCNLFVHTTMDYFFLTQISTSIYPHLSWNGGVVSIFYMSKFRLNVLKYPAQYIREHQISEAVSLVCPILCHDAALVNLWDYLQSSSKGVKKKFMEKLDLQISSLVFFYL